MTAWLHELADRIAGLLRGRSIDHDLDAEIASHLEMAVDDNLRNGMDTQEARRLAAMKFGSALSAKEQVGDQQVLLRMESFMADVRHAVRALLRKPGYTAVAMFTLAIGIGVNAAVFTVTKAALFAGFPLVSNNARVLYLSSGRGCCLSYPDFEDWRSGARSFSGMAVVQGTTGILSDKTGSPESYDGTLVSSNAFSVIGQRPLLGRDFTAADEMPGARPVAILSYAFWDRRFGKNPLTIGKNVRLNGVTTSIVGVMPPGFVFPQKQDLWAPLTQTGDLLHRREDRSLWFAFGRLANGVAVTTARAEMQTIGRRLGSSYPQTNQGRNLLPHVQTFNEFFMLENENVIYASMWGAVGFVLLIACANLANLTLARAMERSREISVKVALGAGRWRIMRQLFLETALLSGVSGILGWRLAAWAVRAYALADRGPGRASWRILDYSMDYRVLAYLSAISVGAAFLFGLAPVGWLSKLNLNAMMKEGVRNVTGGSGAGRLSTLLVTAEMALAVVLLAGAGVMIRSFLNIYSTDLGVKTANVLALSVSLPPAEYTRDETRISYYDRLRATLEAIPGVESVSITRSLPTGSAPRLPAQFAALPDDGNPPMVATQVIGPAYFRTLGAPLLSGRQFTDADRASAIPVAIVNSRLAGTYWPGESPLGKQIRLTQGKTPGEWRNIIGVAPDIVQNGTTRRALSPLIYLPYRQKISAGMEVIARIAIPAATAARAMRKAVQEVDPHVAVFGPVSLEERLRSSYWSSGLYAALFLIFATIALIIAAVGLFAVTAHAVGRRTQEIGIRMAIGATAADIRNLVLRQGMIPAGIGLAIGLIASPAVNRLLKSALTQVSPNDPLVLTVSSATLILAAVLGCLIPARRATRVDPVIALRHD